MPNCLMALWWPICGYNGAEFNDLSSVARDLVPYIPIEMWLMCRIYAAIFVRKVSSLCVGHTLLTFCKEFSAELARVMSSLRTEWTCTSLCAGEQKAWVLSGGRCFENAQIAGL